MAPNPRNMNDEEITDSGQLEELLRDLEDLHLENRVFKSYYERTASDISTDIDEEKRKINRQRRRQIPAVLTAEQKVEIGAHEQEVALKDLEDAKKNSEKLIDTLRAVLEETDIRVADLKKEAYEFKRDIVVGAENTRTGNTLAEKVVRYMEDKLRQRDAMAEKLRLKNTTLKAQLQKVEGQLRHKDDMGDALHYIDFHQLQIENKQYVSRIEGRNDELLKLKMTTGRTVQALNMLKNLLHRRLLQREWLSTEIRKRTETLNEIKRETTRVVDEIATERRSKKRLSQHKVDVEEMPNVDDYIAQKAKLYGAQHMMLNWKRKSNNRKDNVSRKAPKMVELNGREAGVARREVVPIEGEKELAKREAVVAALIEKANKDMFQRARTAHYQHGVEIKSMIRKRLQQDLAEAQADSELQELTPKKGSRLKSTA